MESPFNHHKKRTHVLLLFKILKLNEHSPVKQIYLLLKNETNRNLNYNRLNWAFQIKDMLDQLGFTELWINQDNILTIRLNTIKQKTLRSLLNPGIVILITQGD